jgi:Mrp family chromosome partitioning ATPase
MQHADGIIMVVHQNKTRASVINKAISVLQGGKAKLLGCVVNNVYSSGIMESQGADVLAGGYNKYGKYGKYGNYGDYGKTRKSGSESAGKFGS